MQEVTALTPANNVARRSGATPIEVGAPDLMPFWTILDSTPEGPGADWYPSLSYPAND